MKIDTIFLDMDGVVADFIGGALRVHEDFAGRTYVRQQQLGNYEPPDWPPGEWDVCKVLQIEPDAFWRMIESREFFWANLEALPWAQTLRDVVGAFCGDVKYLTAPCRDPQCAAQKIHWLRNFTGDDQFMGWALTPHKHYLAGPGRVLIDDSDENCRQWIAAGGRAILLPQPWNKQHDFVGDRVHYVVQELCKISPFEQVA